MYAQKGMDGIALLLFYLGAEWRWVVRATLRQHNTVEKPLHLFYRRIGGPQGLPTRVRMHEKLLF